MDQYSGAFFCRLTPCVTLNYLCQGSVTSVLVILGMSSDTPFISSLSERAVLSSLWLSFIHVIHVRSVMFGSRHFSLVIFGFSIGVWNLKFSNFGFCVFLFSNWYIMFSLARLSCVVVLCSAWLVFIIDSMFPYCNVLCGRSVRESSYWQHVRVMFCVGFVLFVP